MNGAGRKKKNTLLREKCSEKGTQRIRGQEKDLKPEHEIRREDAGKRG